MEKLHYIRPELAKYYQSAERTRLTLAVLDLEKAVGLPKGAQRPLKYSCYNEAEGFNATQGVICGGTIRLLGGFGGDPEGGGGRIGIAVQDHVSGQMTDYYTNGTWAMQVDSASGTTGLMGRTAYYIIESGLVTDVATGSGTNRIPIGFFQVQNVYSRAENPNKLTYGSSNFADVLLQQKFDNANIAGPTISTDCGCSSACCDIAAAPAIWGQFGLNVDFVANAVNGNPALELGSLSWNFDGSVTNTGGVVSFAAQAVGEKVSFAFPSAGTYSDVWLIVKSALNGTDCECSNQDVGQAPCCLAYNLTVVVTATSAEIVSCNTVDNSTLRNWSTEKQYTKTTAAQVDAVVQVDFTTSTDQAAAGNITDAAQATTAAAIKLAIENAGFVCGSVLFTVSPAAADGDTQSFVCVVIGTNADLKELDCTINGVPSTSVFAVIA